MIGVSQRIAQHAVPRRRWLHWIRRGARALPLVLLLGGGVAAAAGGGGWLWSVGSGLVTDSTALLGYRVREVRVDGAVHLDAQMLRDLVNVVPGDPILSVDLAGAREFLERLSWVRRATVRRVLPDQIVIAIQERTPTARWQHQNKLYLVDEEGTVLDEQDLTRFSHLPIVIGTEPADDQRAIGGVRMPAPAARFLVALKAHERAFGRVYALAWVGGRRWTLHLDNRIQVKLPDDGFEEALAALNRIVAETDMLDRAISVIDLRQPGRVIVTRQDGAAPEPPKGAKPGTAAGGGTARPTPKPSPTVQKI